MPSTIPRRESLRMNVTVNGEPRDISPGTSVTGLIESLGLKVELIAVQMNDTILDRNELSAALLSEGDVIELIRIVGGG